MEHYQIDEFNNKVDVFDSMDIYDTGKSTALAANLLACNARDT